MNTERTGRRIRRRDRRPFAVALLVVLSVIGLAVSTNGPAEAQRPERYRILLFTKTAGFFHPSIPTAITAIEPVDGRDVFAVRQRLLDEHGILTTACSLARAPLEMTRPSLRISPHVDLAPEHVVALRTALATA